MGDAAQPSSPLSELLASFRAHYRQNVAFREDGALVDALALEAEPVLEVLAAVAARLPCELPGGENALLRDPLALLARLGRRAALLEATPTAALAAVDASAAALNGSGRPLPDWSLCHLRCATMEGYCAERDAQVTAALRASWAHSQIVELLAPGCLAVFLAGRHGAAELQPLLSKLGRRLLHEQIKSCLLDVARLDLTEEEVARAVAVLCIEAATLGVRVQVTGASVELQRCFAQWGARDERLIFAEDVPGALRAVLETAGHTLRPAGAFRRATRRLQGKER